MTATEFERTDVRTGYNFSLALGASYDARLKTILPAVGPRIGFLVPHGFAEFGFETRFSTNSYQTWGFMLSVGPRIELVRTETRYRRSATQVALPAVGGVSFGDGLRSYAGLGADFNYFVWSRGLNYH